MSRPTLGLALLCLSGFVVACNGDKSPSPTAPSTPTPTTVSLTGNVSAVGGAKLGGATVRIFDGVNAGKSTSTDGSGAYRFDGLTSGNGNLVATADGYDESRAGVVINGTNTLNFTLRTTVPWSRSGSGNTVFDMPTYITRVHIIGDYGGRTSNFIIWIGGRLIVNELVGTDWGEVHYEGTHAVTGGTVEVKNSNGVSWSITEER